MGFMALVETIEKDMVDAMKSREALRLSVLRMMKAALQLKQAENGQALSEDQALAVLRTLLKQRRDAAEAFQTAGREDLAEKERSEGKLIEAYLPAAAGESDLKAAVDAAATEIGASSVKDLGRVMKAAMAHLSGKTVDGKRLSEMVRARLGG